MVKYGKCVIFIRRNCVTGLNSLGNSSWSICSYCVYLLTTLFQSWAWICLPFHSLSSLFQETSQENNKTTSEGLHCYIRHIPSPPYQPANTYLCHFLPIIFLHSHEEVLNVEVKYLNLYLVYLHQICKYCRSGDYLTIAFHFDKKGTCVLHEADANMLKCNAQHIKQILNKYVSHSVPWHISQRK